MTRCRQRMLFMKSTWHVKILNCKIRTLVSHLLTFYGDIKNISWFQLNFQKRKRLIQKVISRTHFLTLKTGVGFTKGRPIPLALRYSSYKYVLILRTRLNVHKYVQRWRTLSIGCSLVQHAGKFSLCRGYKPEFTSGNLEYTLFWLFTMLTSNHVLTIILNFWENNSTKLISYLMRVKVRVRTRKPSIVLRHFTFPTPKCLNFQTRIHQPVYNIILK